jgi:hypothetical protein
MRRKGSDTETALANFGLTFAKSLLVFCVILFTMISPEAKKEGIKPKLEFMITMEWPGDLDYDVDIYVRDPEGNIMFYNNREVGFLNLERDDLGRSNNVVVVDGKEVRASKFHEEIVSIRGFMAGEYVVNVHLFNSKIGGQSVPCPITVTMTKFNPSINEIFKQDVVLDHEGEEKHITRFTMTEDGRITHLDKSLPVSLRGIFNK